MFRCLVLAAWCGYWARCCWYMDSPWGPVYAVGLSLLSASFLDGWRAWCALGRLQWRKAPPYPTPPPYHSAVRDALQLSAEEASRRENREAADRALQAAGQPGLPPIARTVYITQMDAKYIHDTPLPPAAPESFCKFWSWGWTLAPEAAWAALRQCVALDPTRSTYLADELNAAARANNIRADVAKETCGCAHCTQAKDAIDGSTNTQA